MAQKKLVQNGSAPVFSVLLSRKFCLDAPFGAARFPLARGRTGRLSARPASRWRPWPPSVRPPQKSSAFPGSPAFSILRRAEPAFRQENFRLSAGNFAWTRRSARLASPRKRPNWTAFSRPASRWRPWPPSVRPPQKSSAFPGSPAFSILRRAEPAFRQENFRLSAGNFAWTRRSARLASARKRPNWTAFSRPASRWRPWPPSVRPLFCCGLYRSPRGCRSGPPPRKSACRGRGPPRR